METRGQTRVLCFPDLATGCGDECEGLPLRRLFPLGVGEECSQFRGAPAGPTFVFGGGDPPGRRMEVSVLETV